jgi:agmatinase
MTNQQPAAAYIRSGQTPFFRLPFASLTADGVAQYEGVDAVLMGVPWDGGTTYRPGARLAPWEVRRASAHVQSLHAEMPLDVFATINAVDGGNTALTPFSAPFMRDVVEREVRAIVDAGAVPFLVGGDHSIALPSLRAVHARHGALAVVHIDAHLDESGPETWGEAFHHGTPIGHAIREGLVARGALHQVGIRATRSHPEEGSLAASHDARRYSMDELQDRGVLAVAQKIRAAVGKLPTYITFDIDGVDPAYAPGTGTPVPGGLSAREALRLIRALAGVRLVGMDVVEVCPDLDVGDATSTLAAHILYEGLAVLASRTRL